MRPVAVLAVAAVLVSLTACSSGGGIAVAGCEPSLLSGSASDSIKVSTGFGETPEVSFPTPIKGTKNERTVLELGKGTVPQDGGLVSVNLSLYDGSAGTQLSSSFEDGQPGFVLMSGDSSQPALVDALACTPVGSRIAITMNAKDFAEAANAAGYEEMAGKNTQLVAVIDVMSSIAGHAVGQARDLPNSFPAIVRAPDGRPGLSFPGGDAPTDTTPQVSVLGNGEVVTETDNVIAQTLSVGWDNRDVIDSTWANGSPTLLDPSGQADLTQAVVGKKVGSQIVVITQDATGAAVVNVVDILAALPMQQ